MFLELSTAKFENPETFNALINKDKVTFIQVEFSFTNEPYSLLIYLPIKNGGEYADKIVVSQSEYANLGYRYILKQADYPTIVAELPKIGKMKLDKYYLDKP